MKPLSQNEPGIAEQAARWIGTLEQGGEREHAAFAAWLRASPQHVREFLMLTAMEKEIGELDLQAFDVAQILENAGGNVVALETARAPERRTPAKRKWNWGIGLAAMVLAGIGGGWAWFGAGAWQDYATAIGEQRTFELEDGSVVELNPLSHIRVKLSATARDIELSGGEALFKVERDPVRPFRVRSGDTVVRAIGTQFTVHRRIGSIIVSVIEGRVEVTGGAESAPAPVLSAGEEIKIVAGRNTVARRTADPGQESAWRQRSLTFSGDSLADIVADFNRYNRSPQILIEGETLRARRFSGVFNVDDPGSLIDYLSQDERLTFERRDGTIVIKERNRN